jgi:hypothetical protein
MSDDAQAVRDLAAKELGLPQTWAEPSGYRSSLALCAIDAVYSLRAKYAGVVNVLDRYRTLRRSQGADPYKDAGPDLLAVIDGAGGPDAASETIFNRNVAPGTEVLKVAALARAVAALQAVGITTAADLREATPVTLVAARTAWTGTRGLGPVSWDYLLMLTGQDGVKADTMLRRFVTRAVGASKQVSVDRARAAVREAADLLGVSPTVLDHRIWRRESGRG